MHGSIRIRGNTLGWDSTRMTVGLIAGAIGQQGAGVARVMRFTARLARMVLGIDPRGIAGNVIIRRRRSSRVIAQVAAIGLYP